MLSLVIGGARSGKSRFAQSLCRPFDRVTYVATLRCEDAEQDSEMAERIRRHHEHRPAHWSTVEAPLEIASAIERHAISCDIVLLDCLTLWLSNLCWAMRDQSEDEIHAAAMREIALIASAAKAASPATPVPHSAASVVDTRRVVLVSNEVGCGLVPESPVGRRFRDLQGWVNQEAAAAADCVYHVVAGIVIPIKPGASATEARA